MSERQWDSEVIDVDNDITAPGASKQTNRTVTDRLIKKPSHEDFMRTLLRCGAKQCLGKV
jgi:hypothetical protein